MRRALTRAILVVLSIVIFTGIIPFSASASTSSDKTTIFSYLTNEMELNSAAACGIMANIEKESGFRANIIIRDSNGLNSGGLCMWNGGRLNNLRNYCNNKGLNYLSIQGQLKYLKHELEKSYTDVYKYLKKVPNTAQGAYNAAHYWCYYFEIPANRSYRSNERGRLAQTRYWPVYGNKTLKTPELQFSKNKTTYDLDDSVTVKWSSAGENTSYYTIYLVKKNTKTDKYDYDNAKKIKVSASEKTYTFKSNVLSQGKYKIYIYAHNEITGNSKKSNEISFSAKCLTHTYQTKITKTPSLTKMGKIAYICKDCKNEYSEKYSFTSYIKTLKVKNLKTDKVTKTSVTLIWDKFDWADGYYIYLKTENGWKKVGTIKQNQLQFIASKEPTLNINNISKIDNVQKTKKKLDDSDSATKLFTVTDLKSGKDYSFKIKAYKIIDEKTYTTKSSKIITAKTNTR